MSIDHMAVLEAYSASFTSAVEGALDRPVPSCPGWTVDDLVEHVAEVQAWWTTAVLAKGEYPDEEAARRAADTGPDRVAGWREINARYLAVQQTYPADGPVWTWWNEARCDTAAALASRQAHEIVVHCWDARNAVGAVEPIPADIAADGVGEFLERFLRGGEWARPFLLRLAAVDAPASWSVASTGGAPALVAEEVPEAIVPDAVVRGTAEQLYLLLWRRLPVSGVAVEGDAALVAEFLAWPGLD
ncbi:maleylpyruvate isomerase family mycothiol-dependent enzyme [Saccharothrix coeruleofusca]|nr:maleylpyruvate isomerase family mycothiol-dependent enzyme [Saccharothrix coeruleofusca]MBP2340519.1 uncharacterized protein (TIGR03083 family) [Saccharothrix coeruleofusca]